jgi:YfiH family protein
VITRAVDLAVGGTAHVAFTGRAEGDLGHAGRWVAVDEVDPGVRHRRASVCDRPWSWLRQVHGARVIHVDRAGSGAGETVDAAVTASDDTALAVLTADCAPIALVSGEGVLGVVHAGWRGLVAGVVEAAVTSMRDMGATEVSAVVGPCIHPECYEFGPADLDTVSRRLGATVRATASTGRPALDLPAAVRAALRTAGVASVDAVDECTACSPAYDSHRARAEAERQAVVVWRTSAPA